MGAIPLVPLAFLKKLPWRLRRCCVVLHYGTVFFFFLSLDFLPLWGCAGDRVEMVVQVQCGTVLKDEFATMLKKHLSKLSHNALWQPSRPGLPRNLKVANCLMLHTYIRNLYFHSNFRVATLDSYRSTQITFWFVSCMNRRLVGSVGRAPVCWAGGHGFEPRPDQHSGSLNNWEENAAFVMTSANG